MDEDLDPHADPGRPLDALRLCRERLSAGDVDGAERVIRWALDFHPNHPGLLGGLSDVAARRGDHEAAIAGLVRAIDLNPGDFAARLQLAALHGSAHDLAKAACVLREALKIAPDDQIVLRRLGDVELRQGDLGMALHLAERLVALSPDAATYGYLANVHLRSGNLDAAETVLQTGRDAFPGDTVLMRRQSDLAARRGDMAGAIALADRIVASRKLEPSAHETLIALLIRNNDLDEAAAAAREALLVLPGDGGLMQRASEIAWRRGDTVSALAHAQAALAARPSDAAAHAYLANLHQRLGDMEAAERALQAALALAPADTSVMLRLSDLAARRNDFTAMLGWAGRAAALRPNEPGIRLHLAGWHANMGNFAAAWDHVNAVIARDPADFAALRRAADLATRQGDLPQAFALLSRALAARPGDATVYGELATLHLHAGNPAQAASALRTGLEIAPADAALLRRLAYVAAIVG